MSDHGRVSEQRRISDYALISDCHTAALIAGGRVAWFCVPRFDSPSVFASLLDRDRGGSFTIQPLGDCRIQRTYDGDTNLLVTRFAGPAGQVEITDCLAVRRREKEGDGIDFEARNVLLRQVRCTAGRVALDVVCDPRPNYACNDPQPRPVGGRWVVDGVEQHLVLDADPPLQLGDGAGLHGRIELSAGQTAGFALHYGGRRRDTALPARLDREAALEQSRHCWQAWSDRLQYRGRYRDAVVRSALVLKALTFAPTGAIVAAPTTSLPEAIGAGRNWDYRYCWLRDSTFTCYALEELAYTQEAYRYRRWLEEAGKRGPAGLRIAYTIDGYEVPPEQQLQHLSGFDGSTPVRVGNDAREQVQLDVYGELMDTAFFATKHGAAIDEAYWSLLSSVAEHVCEHWREPDRGIWEMRIGPQQFVYSKVLCWACLNRALRIARAIGVRAPIRWRREMAAIRADVLQHGYNASVGAFVQTYGSTHLDAANLVLPVVGFIKARDPRMASTIHRTQEQLMAGGLVRRYRGIDDGLSGDEGAFLLCTFWLVDALIMLGERRSARHIFERLLALRNEVGLLSEEYDPRTEQLLGNFPQAFSHLGLITSALNLRHGRPDRRHLSRRKPR